MFDKSDQYCIWEFGDLDLDDQPPLELTSFEGFEDISFKSGELIADKLPLIDFIASRKKNFTDYQFNIPGFPLFSQTLIEALQEVSIDNIEYFDARFVTRKGKVIRGDYKVGNVIGLVSCFDWERSKYDEDYRPFGATGHIEKLVLDPGRIRGERLFRLKEAPRILLVEANIQQHLITKGITGIEFTPIYDYEG